LIGRSQETRNLAVSNYALLIAGPTATGKSALAVAVAGQTGGEIVNADSMQVYSDLEILSARPTAAEMGDVPHHLFGVTGAAEACSVADWHERAAACIADIRNRGALPIFVGGTGLYFSALLEGLAPVPDIPGEIRNEVRAMLASDGPAALHARLAEIDPVMAERLPAGDSQRLTRALEVFLATGRSLADWQQQEGSGALGEAEREGRVTKVVLTRSREELYGRIEQRFDQMIEAGALAEVARLMERGLASDLPAMKALGVPSLMAHLSGEMDLEIAVQEAKTRTRRYAKRQMTWFRNQFADWHRLEAGGADLVAEVMALLSR
jgi:tRNA dimethylallyltransferase